MLHVTGTGRGNLRHETIGRELRGLPDFTPESMRQIETRFEVKEGDRLGAYKLPPGMRTAREIATAIPGASVLEHAPNEIVLSRRDGATYAIEVSKMLDVLRGVVG